MCIPATFLSSQNGFVYRMHTVSVHLEKACNAGDLVSIPGLDRFPGEGKGYPLQYSDLENAMDCIVHGVTKSRTWLSDFQFHLPFVTARLCRREWVSLIQGETWGNPLHLPCPPIQPISAIKWTLQSPFIWFLYLTFSWFWTWERKKEVWFITLLNFYKEKTKRLMKKHKRGT